MNSVLFFTQNRWAFGQIHHALIKRLIGYGVYSNLLDWTAHYTQREHELLRRRYRLLCTQPDAVQNLVNHGWPLDRIVAVAHCERDMALAISHSGVEMFNKLHRHAVVNSDLVNASENFGITRKPQMVRVGLDTDHFSMPIPEALRVVGYGGAKTFSLSNGSECKRGHLVPGIVADVGLQLHEHEFFHHIAMPGYYQDIDALIVSSTYETVGLPALEAAAAGRLAISTEVGYFDGSYGIKCRTDERAFREDAAETLRYYSSNPREFRMACINFRKAVREHHDWSRCVADWVSLFE